MTRFVWYKGLKDLMLIYPVYTLFFEAAGLSIQQISLLLSLWSFPAVILEVPSGVLADRWSRKSMIVLACLLKAICFLLWAVQPSFLFFAFGFFCWGTSEAFSSGAEEALLFDTLQSQGKEAGFESIYGKAMAASSLAVAISCLGGGYVSQAFGYRTVTLISMVFSLITLAVALGFKEVNLFGKHDQPSFNVIKEACKHLVHKKQVRVLVALLVLPISLADMLDEYDALIAASYQVPLVFVGFWVGGRYLLQALGSATAGMLHRVPVRILVIVASLLLLVSVLFPSVYTLFCYFLFYLLLSAATVLQESRIQRSVEEQGRSTVQSLISLAVNLHALIAFSLFALLPSVSSLMLVVSLYCLVSTLCIGFNSGKKQEV